VTPITLPAPDDFAGEVFALVNAERRAAGVAELVWSQCAADEAGPRAERTLPAPTLTHEPLAVTCGDFLYLGENLARGPYTPQEMVTAWMNSAGHRQNILDADFVELGLGCVAYDASDPTRTGSTAGNIGGIACSQVFLGNAP